MSSVKRKVENRQLLKSPTQSQVHIHTFVSSTDYDVGYFVPTITYIALITWMLWLGLGEGGVLPSSYLDQQIGGWPIWSLQFAIAVFVIGNSYSILVNLFQLVHADWHSLHLLLVSSVVDYVQNMEYWQMEEAKHFKWHLKYLVSFSIKQVH